MSFRRDLPHHERASPFTWALKGGPGKVPTERQDPGHKPLLKSEDGGLFLVARPDGLIQTRE